MRSADFSSNQTGKWPTEKDPGGRRWILTHLDSARKMDARSGLMESRRQQGCLFPETSSENTIESENGPIKATGGWWNANC